GPETSANGHTGKENPFRQTAKNAPDHTTDEGIIRLAGRARNGGKFGRLWAGDTAGYASPSEADSALCCLIAYYTRDEAQIDRLFRRSGLMRNKWERKDYRDATIAGALALVKETYHPPAPDDEEDEEGQEAETKAEDFCLGPLTLRPDAPRQTPSGKV